MVVPYDLQNSHLRLILQIVDNLVTEITIRIETRKKLNNLFACL